MKNTMVVNYQLFTGGPDVASKDHIVNKIRNTFSDIGLDKDSDLSLFRANNYDQINHKGNPVGLWLGNQDQADDAEVNALKFLIGRGVPFLPVVSNLNHYKDEVPECLHHINGIPVNDEEAIISTLLAMFHLAPHDKRVFISYCRRESQGVANQLFHALSEKGFSVFFDVISVQPGVAFQRVLLDRLNDFDLVVLLDTPGIASSYWVQEEIITAHHLGVGFLQVVWPNKDSHRNHSLNQPYQLALDHFIENKAEWNSSLLPEIVQKIVCEIMAMRIRSIGSRYRNVVNEFLEKIKTFNRYFPSCNIEYNITPGREIWIKKGSEKICWLWPSTRQPTSLLIHQKSGEIKTPPMAFAGTTRDESNDRILFDGLGIHNEHLFHLCWLRKHLPLKTISLESVVEWLCNTFNLQVEQ